MVKLKLTLRNANGLSLRKHELTHFLTDLDIDILLIQETHFGPHTTFSIPNYQMYRTDRQNAIPLAGGFAILVHRRVPHRHIPHLGLPGESTTIGTPFVNVELLVSSIYVPPTTCIDPLVLNTLIPPNSSSITGGNFNAKFRSWGCRSTNVTGRTLNDFLQTRPDISLLRPDSPTHYPPNPRHLATILDFALLCNMPGTQTIHTVSDLSSDHLPVLIELADGPDLLLPPSRRPIINWPHFRHHLEIRSRPLPLPLHPLMN